MCEGYQVSTLPPYHEDRHRQWGGGVGGARGVPGKKTNPPTRIDRDSKEAVIGVGGVQGSRTQADRLMGAVQDAVVV